MLKTRMKKALKLDYLKLINSIFPIDFYLSHKGYCPCCEKEVIFNASNSWLRDTLVCPNCYSKPRERALMITIEKFYPNWRELVIHESSPIERGASIKLRENCKYYNATQYFQGKTRGCTFNNFRNEDLEDQTFNDFIFDIVVTQDVFEHIYDPEKAFKEIARTLKIGGAHIFTVPIINKHYKTETWAMKGDDNNPIFISEPEFHGNQVDLKGSPVTMHWGFDIVDFIKLKSGLNTTVEYIYNLEYGILGEYIEVLVSKKY